MSGPAWIPPAYFIPGVALAVLGLLLIGASLFVPRRPGDTERPDRLRMLIERFTQPREQTATPSAAPRSDVELTGPVTRHERAMRWPAMIDPDTTPLTAPERRRIIEGLAVVG